MTKLRDEVFTLKQIISAISERKCLICKKSLDRDLKYNWHLPLCKSHRIKYLEEAHD